jgi:hypothetical protein
MKRRKRIVTVVATLAIATGLVLPATAAARSFSYPVYNPGASISVTNSYDASIDVVSWGD